MSRLHRAEHVETSVIYALKATVLTRWSIVSPIPTCIAQCTVGINQYRFWTKGKMRIRILLFYSWHSRTIEKTSDLI